MSSSSTSSSNSDRERLDQLVGPLADVMCDVWVLLGTGRISLRELVGLTRNSVLRLSQTAGEDLQVVVHGTTIAHGEIVIGDDSTTVRVTQIHDQENS
jgi:flagellar motor switch protein FliN/FliY